MMDDAQKRIRDTFGNVPKLPNIKYNINWLANARLLVRNFHWFFTLKQFLKICFATGWRYFIGQPATGKLF